MLDFHVIGCNGARRKVNNPKRCRCAAENVKSSSLQVTAAAPCPCIGHCSALVLQAYAAGSVADLENGTYVSSITPTVAGSYNLVLSLDQQVIASRF